VAVPKGVERQSRDGIYEMSPAEAFEAEDLQDMRP
jgi:hypothetical protein